ncbi:peptidase [Tenuifilaceae bacterium CYCD]|nr:peptidase [Tenuifilaceae bacterium CYCD]
MSLAKLLRVLHRDLSYFLTGMILIYAITGILLNHSKDINPYYIMDVRKVDLKLPSDTLQINIDLVKSKLETLGEFEVKSYYYPQPGTIKVFVKDGTITSNLSEGTALVEKSTRRPIFYQLNMMHKNRPHSWWTWFSDIFAVGLIVVTITGLCLVKGKKGITGRGLIYLIAGIALPLVAMFVFF